MNCRKLVLSLLLATNVVLLGCGKEASVAASQPSPVEVGELYKVHLRDVPKTHPMFLVLKADVVLEAQGDYFEIKLGLDFLKLQRIEGTPPLTQPLPNTIIAKAGRYPIEFVSVKPAGLYHAILAKISDDIGAVFPNSQILVGVRKSDKPHEGFTAEAINESSQFSIEID